MNNPKVEQLLLETGAFTDLDEPVILTSGLVLAPYFVNAEKLLQDNGEWEKYEDDPFRMIKHAIGVAETNPKFGKVIHILSDRVEKLLRRQFIKHDFVSFSTRQRDYVIGGGQRRDWIFSGPVAAELGLPHIAIFKDGKQQISHFTRSRYIRSPQDPYAVLVSDLMTRGSSACNIWIPSLRESGVTIDHLVNVITRLQGGEGNLEKLGVTSHSEVAIDAGFLRENSEYGEEAVKYFQDPEGWTSVYLKNIGVSPLVAALNPDGGKLARARTFLQTYNKVLEEADRMPELMATVQEKYGKPLDEILRNN